MKIKTKRLCLYALLTALIVAAAFIAIPTPLGVSLTLQTLAVCLLGFLLGRGGVIPVLVYIILGAVGLPVFSNFSGGLGVLLGPSGGFIIGFLPLVLLCGIVRDSFSLLLGIVGIFICHIIGILQFSLVTGGGILAAFLSCSLPFILKDILSVVLARFLAERLKKTGIMVLIK